MMNANRPGIAIVLFIGIAGGVFLGSVLRPATAQALETREGHTSRLARGEGYEYRVESEPDDPIRLQGKLNDLARV